MIFSFSHSQYLFLLFVIPLLFFIHFWSLKNRKKKALKFANFDAIARIQGVDFFSKNIVMLFLSLLVIFCMVLSVSGLTIHAMAESSDFSFVIAIDVSQSMEANDILPDRLTVSKNTAIEFIDAAPANIPIGIVSFSGSTYIEQTVSRDRIEVKEAVRRLRIAGYGGTDLHEAILTSTNLLTDEDNKAIILLSDGQFNVGEYNESVEESINYAIAKNVVVHTIAIGTLEGGNTSYSFSRVDESSLESLAYNTGGEFFSANSEASLIDSFLKILKLTTKRVAFPVSDYLILVAIIILVTQFFLSNTRYTNLP